MTMPQNAPSDDHSAKRDRIVAMGSMLLVGFFWALVENLGCMIPRGYSPVQTVWSRYLVHMLFMLVALGPRNGTALVKTKRLKMQIMRAFLMIGMPVCYIVGVSIMPIRDVWAVSWTSSIMLLGMAIWILKERVSLRLWVVSLFSWIGVWIMLGAHLPSLSWKLLAPLGMGFCYALYKVMTRILRTECTHANLFHTALWVFCPLTFLMPYSWKVPGPHLIGIYIGIGIFGYLTLLFLDKALTLAPAALTAPLIYSQLIWVSLFDFMLRGRSPDKTDFVGACIILAATVYVFTMEITEKRQLVHSDH